MKFLWLCNISIFLIIVLTSYITLANDIQNNDLEKLDKNLKILLNANDKEEFLDNLSEQPHSRKKRLIWITDDGRLALPPGTSLTISPTIALPLVRHPPEGFFSNISISFPLTIDFDKLGLTDNQNPLGDLPPIFARSFGRAAGNMLGSYISKYMSYRTKRSILDENILKMQNNNFKISLSENENELVQPKLPEKYKHIFHGGERALLYGAVEDLLSTFGVNGRACLLRTICEIHSRSIEHLGLFGEMTKLFLTASKSPFSDYIEEYVEAEQIGEGKIGPGECFPYYKACPKSIFKSVQNYKYRKNSVHQDDQEMSVENIESNENHKPNNFSM